MTQENREIGKSGGKKRLRNIVVAGTCGKGTGAWGGGKELERGVVQYLSQDRNPPMVPSSTTRSSCEPCTLTNKIL